jgi:predicted PurR-regulated permease PerM
LGFVAVNTVMGNVVEPRFLGRGLGLSTLVVFLSLIFWGWLLGTVGMLLSVPLTMIVKIAMESREETRWLAVLLSGDDEITISDNLIEEDTQQNDVDFNEK